MSTTDDMKKDILDAVRKSLPASVGETLQAELAELAELRKGRPILEDKIRRLEIDVSRKDAEIQSQRKMEEREAALATREAKLQERELNCSHREAASEAAVQSARADTAMEAMRLVFRNAEVRRTIHGTQATVYTPIYPGPNGNGMMTGMPQSVGVPTSETETEEQV